MEGQIDLKHMKKAEKKALRLAVVTSLMGGMSVKVASTTYHIAESTVQVWKRMWKEAKTNEPEKAIQEGQRGRRMGACRTLTPEQEEKLQAEIVGKTPDQYQYEFALWSAQAVKLHILKRFGIDMPDRTVRFYLKRWGWTPQHPIRKAYEQNPKATKEWLETTYPAIKEEAKENKGIIYWGDETGVQAYANRPRGYSPRGVTPEARIVANRGIKLNMVSAINNQGKIHYMIYDKAMNVDIFISFMECLIRGNEGRKVYFIVDNLKVHHANCLHSWLKAHAKELELHYLPSYSPELNPDEYLNNDLKTALNKGAPARGSSKLKEQVVAHMEKRSKDPTTVAKLFQHPKVAYAADDNHSLPK